MSGVRQRSRDLRTLVCARLARHTQGISRHRERTSSKPAPTGVASVASTPAPFAVSSHIRVPISWSTGHLPTKSNISGRAVPRWRCGVCVSTYAVHPTLTMEDRRAPQPGPCNSQSCCWHNTDHLLLFVVPLQRIVTTAPKYAPVYTLEPGPCTLLNTSHHPRFSVVAQVELCGHRPDVGNHAAIGDNSCATARNGQCEDGGPGNAYFATDASGNNFALCGYATDSDDCPSRYVTYGPLTYSDAAKPPFPPSSPSLPPPHSPSPPPYSFTQCNNSCSYTGATCSDGGMGAYLVDDVFKCNYGEQCNRCGPRNNVDTLSADVAPYAMNGQCDDLVSYGQAGYGQDTADCGTRCVQHLAGAPVARLAARKRGLQQFIYRYPSPSPHPPIPPPAAWLSKPTATATSSASAHGVGNVRVCVLRRELKRRPRHFRDGLGPDGADRDGKRSDYDLLIALSLSPRNGSPTSARPCFSSSSLGGRFASDGMQPQPRHSSQLHQSHNHSPHVGPGGVLAGRKPGTSLKVATHAKYCSFSMNGVSFSRRGRHQLEHQQQP